MEDLFQRGFNESYEQFERTISMENLKVLKELNLLEQIKYVCAMPGLINVVFEDYSDLLEGRNIVGYLNCDIKAKEKLIINKVKDKVATKCIIYITCGTDCKLSYIMNILQDVLDNNPELELVYGTGYNSSFEADQLKIFGLFVA